MGEPEHVRREAQARINRAFQPNPVTLAVRRVNHMLKRGMPLKEPTNARP